ncbi:hypothetical protein FDI69_gp068 [Rhodococcus phage Trina]|uniref:Uncharacterized protein n=1 Tax=Rhodococcus phage Trina TaxID=2027905 RepID=A0A2D1A226_9CAUD|nr:hypothetical protein FDI69_gp068 [Rhodococcus phage Trina]ASZ74882.1 hypothetical protein SEA_TRINA_68 [Rhodococcus phage Trina]
MNEVELALSGTKNPQSNKKKMHVVEQGNVGMYVWIRKGQDSPLANENREILNVPAVKGDLRAIATIQKTAKYLGYPEGNAVWVEAHRCSEDEYEEQLADFQNGILPIGGARR